MFYVSAIVAVTGSVAYQYLVKRIPETINPIVSVIAMYLTVIVIGIFLLPFFPSEGGIRNQIRQVNWIQVGVAVTVIMIQLGYLLMYRHGWELSTASIVTGVFINLILVGLGITFLGEKISLVNIIGVILSILGVAMTSYKS